MNHSNTIDELEQEMITCRRCPRLVSWREEIALKKRRAYRDWNYWGKPVPGFGDPDARLLVVGLAPGAHGSNRTGQMFTGDESGKFLYRSLHQAGFANHPETMRTGDGMVLKDVFITAICRCVPPDNKPTREEIDTCQPYLLAEMNLLTQLRGIVLLGRIAYDGTLAALKKLGAVYPKTPFQHGVQIESLNAYPWLVCSYHPSGQNTQTRRLTREMFDQIWEQAKNHLNQE